MAGKYNKGKIYKIINDLTDDVYVGSTINTLSKRMASHRSDSKRTQFIFYEFVASQGGWDNFHIILVEDFSCERKEQLCQREQYYIDLLCPTLNSHNAHGLNLEKKKENNTKYCQKNIEKIKKYCANYRQVNIEALKERKIIYCQENKEAIKENRVKYNLENIELIKENRAKYYLENVEAIKENRLKYYLENIELIKEYNIKYRKENIDAIKESDRKRAGIKYSCCCGKTLRTGDKATHERTKTHIKRLLSVK